MTQPIDVWGIERADGSLVSSSDGRPQLFISSHAATRTYILAVGDRPVALRIVRRDEADQFAAAVRGLATVVTGRDCPPVTAANLHEVLDEVLAVAARLRRDEAAAEAGSDASALIAAVGRMIELRGGRSSASYEAVVHKYRRFVGLPPVVGSYADALDMVKDGAPMVYVDTETAPAPVTRAEFEALRECVINIATLLERGSRGCGGEPYQRACLDALIALRGKEPTDGN